MFRLFNRYWSLTSLMVLIVEAGVVVAALQLAHRLRSWIYFGFSAEAPFLYSGPEFWLLSLPVVGTVLFLLYAEGMYEFNEPMDDRRVSIGLLRALTISTIILLILYFTMPQIAFGRAVFAMSMIFILFGLWGCRRALRWALRRHLISERVLIVGSDEAAKDLAREILSRKHLGYRVLGFLSDDPALQGVSIVNPKVIGKTDKASELARAHRASVVVVAQQDSRGQVSLNSLMDCKLQGIPVARSSDYYERLTGKVLLDGIRVKSWLIFSQGFVIQRSTLFAKRAIDLAAGAIGLVIAAPLMLLVAIAIKCESRGPVFYRQERVGRNGRLFTLWKFRSMRDDAESVGGAQWAAEVDPRITRIGRFLRKSRLDELPQLWNVLNGSMSLVGPRPERRVFVDRLRLLHPLYEQRHKVRPGLTGWAQIKAAYAASVEESIEKLGFDLYYIKNLSAFLDLSILFSTLRIVLVGRGAR